MNEHGREDNELKESEADQPERVRFFIGKGQTPEQIAQAIKDSYKDHFGVEMFPTEETK
jgi:hypothetical protein